MDSFFSVLTFVVAFFTAYSAGKMRAILDLNEVEGEPVDWGITVLWVLNILFSFYLMFSIYGMGIARGQA
jgi:hypothetical protein